MLEPFFCPCCTPALLHTLAQANLATMPRQVLWLGTEAISQAMTLTCRRSMASQDELRRPVGEL